MNKTSKVSIAATIVLATSAIAADPEVTFRADARVVTVDVMVEDVRTRTPVSNLTRDDFRVRIDGKERPVTYFGRDGAERRPLAMLVYLNLTSASARWTSA